MTIVLAMTIVLMALGIEWLSLLILGLWTGAAALWLIVKMGEHNAL